METIQLNLEMTQYFILIDSLGRAFYDIRQELIENKDGPIDMVKQLEVQSLCGVAGLYKQCIDVAKAEFPEDIAKDMIEIADDKILDITNQKFYQKYLTIVNKNKATNKKIKKKEPEPTN